MPHSDDDDDDFPRLVSRGRVPVDVQSLEYDGSSFKGVLCLMMMVMMMMMMIFPG